MPNPNKEMTDLFTKGKDFFDIYSKVAEFSKELMEENKKLQGRINELITERERVLSEGGEEGDPKLLRRLEELKREKQEILSHYRQVEEENSDFLHRYQEIETENNNLANLYVASYQLHSTLDQREVLEIITEIIINLIGAHSFGILMLNDKRGLLEPVKAEGIPIAALPAIRVGEGIIGQSAKSGETYYRDSADRPLLDDYTHPLVCLPLKIKEEVIGVIVVYQLFAQKPKLVRVDYDLFNLLAAHAATAIFSAKLYGDSVRKQATIKGFLDLLTH
jgi:hypothetical protein